MPKPFPEEFRRDVVAVARKREAPLTQIAKDFGISEPTLHNWFKKADIEDGNRPGMTKDESAELREAKRRIRLLEQEAEVMRRAVAYLSRTSTQNDVPAGPRPRRGRDSRHGDLPGARLLDARVRHMEESPITQRDWDNAHLINAAYDIHADDPAFGYRFIADELASRGIIAGGNRVARLCSQQHIWSVFAKKKGLNRKSGPPVHDDLVSRRFTAQSPNQLWRVRTRPRCRPLRL